MQKSILAFILIFTYKCLIGQADTIYKFDTKYYRVYTSLNEAQKVNSDSVFGLFLCCEGLKEFPLEVLKYKNLKFLYFYSPNWDDKLVYKQLSDKQKKKFHKIKSRQGLYDSGPPTPEFFPKNKIEKIPYEITQLKKLEVLALPDSKWDDAFLEEILRLEKLMPTTEIDPPSKAIALQLKWKKENELKLESKE